MRIRISILNICCLLVGFSLFAASIGSVKVMGFQLTPYRVGIPVLYVLILCGSRSRESQGPSVQFMLFWTIYAIISLIWCQDTSAWGKAVYFIAMGYMATYVFTRVFTSPEHIVNCCKAYSIGIFFHNIIGWYEITTGNYHWIREDYYEQLMYTGSKVPISVFYNPNDYATALLFGIFAILVVLAYTHKRIVRSFFIALLGSSIIQLVLTQSRANLLGLIIGIGIVLLVKNNKSFSLIVVVFFMGCALIILPIGDYINKFVDTYLNFNFSVNYNSENLRIELWSSALRIFLKTLGFGAGAGNIAYRIVHDNAYSLSAGSVHNWWIEILSTYGLLIFVLYCKNYLSMIIRYYFESKIDGEYNKLYLYMFGFLIAFILGSISSSSMITSEPIWCVWAVLLSLFNMTINNKALVS